MPTARRPSCRSARRVVTVPAKGSSTVSPGQVERRIARAASSRGITAGCSPPADAPGAVLQTLRHSAGQSP